MAKKRLREEFDDNFEDNEEEDDFVEEDSEEAEGWEGDAEEEGWDFFVVLVLFHGEPQQYSRNLNDQRILWCERRKSCTKTTVIPKAKDLSSVKEDHVSQEALNKAPRGGIYGEYLSEKAASSSWAYTCVSCTRKDVGALSGKPGSNSASNDDLFSD
ncbi:hypothetical protein V6N12_074480 [Hibiscus sabdariffa]|uniref:Uncharacterized protein n=1 Tax=Hibiscus sabdariffa TaxID=183260 RepID=A0ABR1ZQY0_9ROSI